MALNRTSGLTCLACQLVFSNGEIQRNHYRSDWHLYNIKRQVANLAPISEQEFHLKQQQFEQVPSSLPNGPSGILACTACGNKKFGTRNAYENHLNSRKHKLAKSEKNSRTKQNEGMKPAENIKEEMKEREQSGKDNILPEDGDKNEQEKSEITPNECLFCPQQYQNWEMALEHMTFQHGFFIPDMDYCSDVPALLDYLGFKIGVGLTCIRCQCTRFRTLDDLRKHMRDSNHCNFRIDGSNEKGENEALLEFIEFYDYGMDEEENWQSEDGAQDIFYEENGFLILPSGARIGHRSLMRYFRQKLKPIREEEFERRQAAGKGALGPAKIGSKLKQLGWTGTTGSLSVAHARDVTFLKRVIGRHKLNRDLASNKLFVSRGRKDQM